MLGNEFHLFSYLYKYRITHSSCFHLVFFHLTKKICFCFFLGSCTFLYFLLDFVSRMSNKSVSIFIFFLGLAVLKGIQNTEERHLKTTSLDIETTYKKTEAENPGILVTYTQLQQAASKFQPTDFRPTNPGNSPGVGHSHGRHWFGKHITRQRHNLDHIENYMYFNLDLSSNWEGMVGHPFTILMFW